MKLIIPSVADSTLVPNSIKNFGRPLSTTDVERDSNCASNCESLPAMLSRYFSFSFAADSSQSIDILNHGKVF